MKKNFVRVMLFGALTLTVSTTVTSCKDYDDDIKNLQEQIDKVTSTNPVSTEDMKAAISSATKTLQTQLQTAIDGKADSKAVQDLLKTVKDLQTALENKADASTVKALGDKVTELSEQVNSIKGTLEETKKDLEAKVADLTEKLAGAVSSEDLDKLAKELADAKNELAAVKEIADNNATAIVKIQTSISELQNLGDRITALETFNETAASKDDLAAYVAHSELAGLVDTEVVNLLGNKGSIAKYVNDAIESQVLAESSAINLAIKGVDAKLAKLSSDFESYKAEQAAAYQTVTGNITTLTTFKTTIEAALTKGGYENFEAVLTEISTIKDSYGYCATKEEFNGKVDAYLATYKSEVNERFTALETRIAALENQIQSVVYIPDYEDGKVSFMSYFYNNQLVAETKPIQIKFRVSPATAAANFAENYTSSFDGQELKTRAAGIYNIENTEVDVATGIVTFTVSTSTDKSYAVSLNLIAKDQSKNLTNISSNYFPVISDYRVITGVTVKSPNEAVDYILYDRELSVVDYATGASLQVIGTDRADNAINESMASSVNTEKLVVSYGLKDADDKSFYTIADGILKLKNYVIVSNGKQVVPEATVKIANSEFTQTTEFAKVTARAATTDPSVTVPMTNAQYDGTKDHVAAVAVPYGTGAGKIGIDQVAYEKLSPDNFTFTEDHGVVLRLKDATTTNELEIVVPKGTVKSTYTPSVKVKVSNVQSFTLTASIAVEVTDANYTLTYDSNIIHMGSILALKANLLPIGMVPTSVNFETQIPLLFGNYQTVVDNAERVGASVQFSLKDAITGVSFADNVLKVDNTYSNSGDNFKDIIIVANVIGKDAAGADLQLVNSKETKFTLADISGEWVKAEGAGTVKIGSDNLNNTFSVAKGISWNASNGKKMWEAGTEAGIGEVWGAAPLGIFGLEAPTFALKDPANVKYVTLDAKTGALTLTAAGKILDTAVNIVVDITAASRWGTITNFDGGKEITVKIDLSKAASAIN